MAFIKYTFILATTIHAGVMINAFTSPVTAFMSTFSSSTVVNLLPMRSTIGRRGNVIMFSDQVTKLNDQVAKLRAEAEKLEKELAAVAATRPKPPASESKPDATPTPKYLTFEQLKAEVSKSLSSSSVIDTSLKKLKEEGMLKKYASQSAKGFRRFTPDSFQQQTGFLPQEIESGGTQDDLKKALAVVLATSTLGVFAANQIGGNIGTTLVYLLLLFPILFIGIGSSAPGVISVMIVAVNNLLDGKGKERRVSHEAARFLTGYLLGLPIESVSQGEELTRVKFYDTESGNINELTSASKPDSVRKFSQEDILPQSVYAIAGSVAERLEFGKVIDRQGDFLYLLALMDLVRPSLRAAQKNEHVIYTALQAHKILTSNKSRLQAVQEKIAARAPLEELIAAVEG